MQTLVFIYDSNGAFSLIIIIIFNLVKMHIYKIYPKLRKI